MNSTTQCPALTLDWVSPLSLAAECSEDDTLILLHNGLLDEQAGNHLSILALNPQTEVHNRWDNLESRLSTNQPCWNNAWFGWLGYELNQQLEQLDDTPDSFLSFADLWMAQCADVLVFEHRHQRLTYH